MGNRRSNKLVRLPGVRLGAKSGPNTFLIPGAGWPGVYYEIRQIVHSKIAVDFFNIFFNAIPIPVGTCSEGICRNGREIDLYRQLEPEANHALPRGMLAP